MNPLTPEIDMPTLNRARHIQSRMAGDIYFDLAHQCFRVMESNSPSLRRHNHYILVERWR